MCQPEDTFGFVKEQVALANQEYQASQMRLILPKKDTILEDADKVNKYPDDVKNETELYVVFQISDGEWEQVMVTDSQPVEGP